jgi:hypothetical protein
VAVATKLTDPKLLPAGTVAVPVHVPLVEVPLVSDKVAEEPLMGDKLTDTPVMVAPPLPAAVTLRATLSLRTAVDGVAMLAEMLGGMGPA